MTRRLAVLTCLVLASVGAGAEPTPAIRYLLGHPATMMDLGLLRLQGALERMIRLDAAAFALAGQHPGVVAYYDEDDNLIRIEFVDAVANAHSLPPEDWDQLCRARFERVRALFRGDKTTPGIAAQFGHIGWPDGNRPFSLNAELRNMTVIHVYAQFADARAECNGRLVGTDVNAFKR